MAETKSDNLAGMKRIKQSICDHLMEPITASAVANAAGYSQYHAAGIVKAETGLTPFEYIRRDR